MVEALGRLEAGLRVAFRYGHWMSASDTMMDADVTHPCVGNVSSLRVTDRCRHQRLDQIASQGCVRHFAAIQHLRTQLAQG